MINRKYILDTNGEVQECTDLNTWAKWLESSNDRVIAICEKNGVKVSTVFLGLDHSFIGGPPVLFETVVFGGEHDQKMDRYCTKKKAEKGHKQWCLKVFGEEKE